MKSWNIKFIWVLAAALFLQAPQALAGNGGNIFAQSKSKLELNKEAAAKRSEQAHKRTAELNKKLKKQQRKEAKAKAKAKAKAQKEAAKKRAKKTNYDGRETKDEGR